MRVCACVRVLNLSVSLFADEVRKKFSYARRHLDEGDNAALLKHKWALVQSISVDDILPDLISVGVVSPAEKEEVK